MLHAGQTSEEKIVIFKIDILQVVERMNKLILQCFVLTRQSKCL